MSKVQRIKALPVLKYKKQIEH